MSAASKNVTALRINKGLPKAGESLISTASRALLNPTTHRPSHVVDASGNLIRQRVYENFADHDTNDAVSTIGIGGADFATTTALVHHMYTPGGNIFCAANIGVQTTPAVMSAAGLDIRGVETNAIGTEFFTNFLGASGGAPFIIGKSPAFFLRVSITVADISGCTVLLAGFRRAAVNKVTYTDYADYGAIGIIASANPGAINIAYENDGSGSPTDTTDTWADAATKILEIKVSAAGVLTYTINGVAPTVTLAGTFDDGDPVIPFLHFIQHTDVAGAITLNSWESGFQGS